MCGSGKAFAVLIAVHAEPQGRNRNNSRIAELHVACFLHISMHPGKPLADLGNHLRWTMITGNCANANVGTFISPSVFDDSALESTPSPVAYPMHSQGTVTIGALKNAEFAPFTNSIEGCRETICGSGKPFAVLTGRSREPKTFCTFPEGCPAAPGDCSIWRMHYRNVQHSCTHISWWEHGNSSKLGLT